MAQAVNNRVSLADVVRVALPLDSRIVTDVKVEKRPINWIVALTELDNLSEQAQSGDLVIVPPTLQAQADGPKMRVLIESLGNLDISGFLFFNELSPTAIKLADDLQTPLVQVIGKVTFREVNRSTAALLLDRQRQITERGMQLYRELSEMSREGISLQDMTDLMMRLTGKIVLVQDKRMDIRAISWPEEYLDVEHGTLRQELINRESLPQVLRNRKQAAKVRQTHWQQLLPFGDAARIISPIIAGDRARGYLSVVGEASDLDLLDTVTVEQGAAAIALDMAKAKAVSEAKKELIGEFIENVVAGTMTKAEIERREAYLEYDTKRPHAILSFMCDGKDAPSMKSLESTLNWVLGSQKRPYLVHTHGDAHVSAFLSMKKGDTMDKAKSIADDVRTKLATEYPKAHLVVGLSGPALTLTDWPQIFKQAVHAMELGQRLKLEHSVEYNSLGVYRLLNELEDLPIVQAFAEQMIGPLADYDRSHRSSLVQTIDAYFKHNGNVSQTAESLYIHRNTLLYRIERIKKLTGCDLDQEDLRLALHLALKLWQLRPREMV